MNDIDPTTAADEARGVLRFWLEEIPAEKRFARDDALDATIRERFTNLRERLLATRAEAFRDDPKTLLGAIVALDQFSRNMFRGSPDAFAADPLARELARHALDKGWEREMTTTERQFLYLPFMHSEDLTDQALCVKLCRELGEPNTLAFAEKHAAQIERFGRFPQRNEALGRDTTSEEAAFLEQPGTRF